MKKSNFMALILGTIGGVFFSLGMCMGLLPEWGMQRQGIVSGVVGMVILLVTVLLWRKMEGKAPIKISGKTLLSVFVGIIGALLLGVGLCMTIIAHNMVVGIGVGILGIVILLMLIPLVAGLK